MTKKKEALQNQFIETYKSSLFNVSVACTKLGISRGSYYIWMKEDSDFSSRVADAKESLIDFVESKLVQQINDNNLTAIIFFLKCKAKNRGYIDREEIKGDDGIDWENITFRAAEAADLSTDTAPRTNSTEG